MTLIAIPARNAPRMTRVACGARLIVRLSDLISVFVSYARRSSSSNGDTARLVGSFPSLMSAARCFSIEDLPWECRNFTISTEGGCDGEF